jgi:multiple sugar transport system substrate-binding protein
MDRRAFLKLALGASGLTLLAACAPTPATPTSPPAGKPTAPGAQATVAPATKGGKITVQVNSGEQERVSRLAEDYTRNTGTEVEVQGLPYDQAFQKLQIALSQRSDAFDVASMDDPWMPQFAGKKFLANLDEMFDRAGAKPSPDFQPQLFALGTWPPGSGLRAVPWIGNVQVFAWRSDLINQRPNTWDDVVATAQKVKADNPDVFGYAIRGAAGNPATTSYLPIIRGYGTDVLNEKFEPQLHTDKALAALDTALKLRDAAPPGAENVQHADVSRFMYTGTAAMSGDIWPDQLLQMFDPALSQVVGKVQIGPEPSQPGASPANMTGTWLLGIPEGSNNKERAFDFIVWFTHLERQKRLLMEYGTPPTVLPLFNDQEAVARFPFLSGLLQAAEKAVPRPRTEYYSAVEDIIGRYVSQVIAGQSEPKSALEQANREVRDLLVRHKVLSG